MRKATWLERAKVFIEREEELWGFLASPGLTLKVSKMPRRPLCQEFLKHPKGDCHLCPVKLKTFKAHCQGTIYTLWEDLTEEWPEQLGTSLQLIAKEMGIFISTLKYGLSDMYRELRKEYGNV